jgi:hypothetical protein
VSISEEIRASAGAHRDLGPGYDTAIAEGLVERIGDEIDKRVDARMYRHFAPAPAPLAPPVPPAARPARGSGPGFFSVTLALGSMAMALAATAVVLHPESHNDPAGPLVALIWIAVGAINYFWTRKRLR